MTISNELVSVQVAGNGVQTLFDYNFMIPAQSYAKLILTDADGNETELATSSWSLTGVGNAAGGTFTYPRSGAGGSPAPTGSTLTLVREVPYAQITNLRNQGAYYPKAVEGALDFIVMQVQQLAAIFTRTVRVATNEPPIPPLLNRILRANKLLGFGSSGEITYYDALNVSNSLVTTTGGNTARSLAARFDEPVDIRDFGAVGDWDGSSGTDNTNAINAAFAYAVATQRMALVPAPLNGKIGFYCGDTVSLLGGAAGLHMVGTIYSPGNRIALLLGDGGTNKNQYKVYTNLSVRRATQSDWTSESDIGIRIRNADGCVISTNIVTGFTVGLQTYGDGTGFEDSTIILGTHIDNKVQLDVRCNAALSWNNGIKYIGGHFANSSGTNYTVNRYGVRFSNEPGGCDRQNLHAFFGLAFELQDRSTTGANKARNFLFESEDTRGVHGYSMRSEASGAYMAEVPVAANDITLEFDFVGGSSITGFSPSVVGTPGMGFNTDIEYGASATRSGVSLIVRHQAGAAHATPRLIFDVPNVRATAFIDETVSTGGIGFEKMTVLSGNPSGPPTTLNGFCWPALGQVGLYDDYVQLSTARSIAVVLPCDKTKEFFCGIEGDNLRLTIMQFDSSENLLGSGYPPTLSNANMSWNLSGTAYWWEMSTNLDQLTSGFPLAKLQRVRAHPTAAFIVIGVRGGDSVTPTNNHLRAFRIYTSAIEFPGVLFGNGRSVEGVLQGRRWGSREWTDQAAYDFPNVAGGATGTQEFVANGCRQGDEVGISYRPDSGFQNGMLRYNAVIGGSQSTNRVMMYYQNVSGSAINPASGTMYIYGRRRRAPNG
jgi:hypothetical protein